MERLHKVNVLVTQREAITHKLRISRPPLKKSIWACRGGQMKVSSTTESFSVEGFFRSLDVRKTRIFQINKQGGSRWRRTPHLK